MLGKITNIIKKEKNFLNTYNPYVPKDHNYLILKNYNLAMDLIKRELNQANNAGEEFKFNAIKYDYKQIAKDVHFKKEINMAYDSLLQSIEKYKATNHEDLIGNKKTPTKNLSSNQKGSTKSLGNNEETPTEITGYSAHNIRGTYEDGIGEILDKFVNINNIVNNPVGYLINEINKTNNHELDKSNHNDAEQSKLLINHCKTQLKKKIMIQSIKASVDTATLISTAVFSVGIFFPPAIIPLSITAIAIVGAGLVLGTIAGFIQRIRFNKAIDNAITTTSHDNSLQKAITSKLNYINNKKENHAFIKAHNAFSIGVVLSGIAGFTKYFLLPAMQSVLSIGSSALNTIKSIFDIFKHHRDRQKNLTNIQAFMGKMVDQQHFDITKKKYMFFGKSELEKYNKKYKKIIPQHNKDINDKSFTLTADDVFLHSLADKFEKYKQKHHIDNNNTESVLFGKFMQESLLNNMSKDLVITSVASTLQLALFLGGASFMLFPPAGIIVATGIIVSSLIVTPIIRLLEKRKLLKKFKEQSETISDYTNKMFNQMINRKDYIDLTVQNTGFFNKKSTKTNGTKKPVLFTRIRSMIKKKTSSSQEGKHKIK